MKFINHPEGYIEPDGTGGYAYVYQYKDHLGTIRLSYSDTNADGAVDNTEIVEESNYYPFGLKHRGYNDVVNGMPNKFLTYNGKEFEEALGLNMHEMDMRHYDPAIARWVVQDPITHHSLSPYNAFDNNPVFWADPSGADAQFDAYNQSYDGDNIAWVLNYSGDSVSEMVEFNNKVENRSRTNPPTYYIKGECFCSYYDDSGNRVTESPNGIEDFSSLSAKELTGFDEPVFLLGEGIDIAYDDVWKREQENNVELLKIMSLGLLALDISGMGATYAYGIGMAQFSSPIRSFSYIPRYHSTSNQVKVGQWMTKAEYNTFMKTGIIPRGNVLAKGSSGFNDKNLTHYVEFNVSKDVLRLKDVRRGWYTVLPNNKVYQSLYQRKGLVMPQAKATNINLSLIRN